MTPDQLMASAGKLLSKTLKGDGFCEFDIQADHDSTVIDDPDYISVLINVSFKAGNVEKKHKLVVAWSSDQGMGFEYGEDCDIVEITPASIWRWLYYDLTYSELNDEFLL